MFKTGQEIIAIRTHSRGVFKKGDVFIVKAVSPARCNCCSFAVDIGIKSMIGVTSCSRCGKSWENPTSCYWFANNNFTELETTEAEQVMEEELICV